MVESGKLKFVIAGDKGVGKRSLLTYGFGKPARLSSFYIPIEFVDVEVKTRTKKWDITCYDSLVNDTMVSKNESSLVKNFTYSILNGADAVLLCYSANDEGSFRSLRQWYKDFSVYFSPNTLIFLVETKTDLPNVIDQTERSEFLNHFRYERVYGVCAMKKDDVVEMFLSIIDKIESNREHQVQQKNVIKETFQSPEKKKSDARDIRYSDKKERIVLMEGSYTKKFTITENATASNRLSPKKVGAGDDLHFDPKDYEDI
jgi:GTPase SAR1 family protein